MEGDASGSEEFARLPATKAFLSLLLFSFVHLFVYTDMCDVFIQCVYVLKEHVPEGMYMCIPAHICAHVCRCRRSAADVFS